MRHLPKFLFPMILIMIFIIGTSTQGQDDTSSVVRGIERVRDENRTHVYFDSFIDADALLVLPPEIGTLTNVRYLSLRNNRLVVYQKDFDGQAKMWHPYRKKIR